MSEAHFNPQSNQTKNQTENQTNSGIFDTAFVANSEDDMDNDETRNYSYNTSVEAEQTLIVVKDIQYLILKVIGCDIELHHV